VTSKINPAPQAGQTYWVEVQGLAADTMDLWYTNSLSLGGGMQDINTGGWSALTGLYGGQTLPAFSVTGVPGYSDFGPNPFASNSWCVSGANGANCTTFATRYIAAPFTSGSTFTVLTVALALSNISGTNGAVINLMNSTSSGVPGTVLESWQVSNLPSSSQPAVTSLTSKINPTLQAGQSYWVEVQGLASDTMDVWYTNNLGLGGGMQNINQAGWTALSGYGSQTLPAFDVLGGGPVITRLRPIPRPFKPVSLRPCAGTYRIPRTFPSATPVSILQLRQALCRSVPPKLLLTC
jgi:hypothetical protein